MIRNLLVAVDAIRTEEILRVILEALHSRGDLEEIHGLTEDIGGHVQRERSRHVRFRREDQIRLVVRTDIVFLGEEGVLIVAREFPDVAVELAVEVSIRQQTLNLDSGGRGGTVEIHQVAPYERTN